MLTSTDAALFRSGLELAEKLQRGGINMFKPAAFVPGHFKIETLGEVKHMGIRIVILMAFNRDLHDIALSSEEQGMMESGWAWITPKERVLIPQLQGWLFLRPLLASDKMQAFAQQVSDYSTSHFNITVAADLVDLTFSAALHDAVMLYAHAATKVLNNRGDLHDGQAIASAVRSTRFEGVGGSIVDLSAQGDRIESFEVMNYIIGADGEIQKISAGVYSHTERQYTASERAVVWPGRTSKVPVAYMPGTSDLLCDPPVLG